MSEMGPEDSGDFGGVDTLDVDDGMDTDLGDAGECGTETFQLDNGEYDVFQTAPDDAADQEAMAAELEAEEAEALQTADDSEVGYDAAGNLVPAALAAPEGFEAPRATGGNPGAAIGGPPNEGRKAEGTWRPAATVGGGGGAGGGRPPQPKRRGIGRLMPRGRGGGSGGGGGGGGFRLFDVHLFSGASAIKTGNVGLVHAAPKHKQTTVGGVIHVAGTRPPAGKRR